MTLPDLLTLIEARGLDFTIIKDTAGFTGEVVYTFKVAEGGCMPSKIAAAQGRSLQSCIDQVAAQMSGQVVVPPQNAAPADDLRGAAGLAQAMGIIYGDSALARLSPRQQFLAYARMPLPTQPQRPEGAILIGEGDRVTVNNETGEIVEIVPASTPET